MVVGVSPKRTQFSPDSLKSDDLGTDAEQICRRLESTSMVLTGFLVELLLLQGAVGRHSHQLHGLP